MIGVSAALLIALEVLSYNLPKVTHKVERNALEMMISIPAWKTVGYPNPNKKLMSFCGAGIILKKHHLTGVGCKKCLIVYFKVGNWGTSEGFWHEDRFYNFGEQFGGRVTNILESNFDNVIGDCLNLVDNDPRSLSVFGDFILPEHSLGRFAGLSYGVSSGDQSVFEQDNGPETKSCRRNAENRHDPLCIRILRRSQSAPPVTSYDWLLLPLGYVLGVFLSWWAIGLFLRSRTNKREKNNRSDR